MSWVKEILNGIQADEEVKVRPHGGSMRGRIDSGQTVTLRRASIDDVVEDDIVFVRWKGNYLLHLVRKKAEDRILIANNLGKVNGWVNAGDILAKVIRAE